MEIFSKIQENDRKYVKFLGIKLFENIYDEDYTKTKYLYGILKIIKNKSYKKTYLFGIQILSKPINNIYEQMKILENEIESLKLEIINNTNTNTKLQEETFMMNAISNLHTKTFTKYKNKHSNENIVITGTGPTLNYYKPLHNAIHISLNRAFKTPSIHFDYAFISHYSETSAEYINDLKNYDCIKFFGKYYKFRHLFMNIPEVIINEANAEEYYINTDIDYPFIQDISSVPLKNGGSISFAALQFALWTNPKKIYIVGCDTNMGGYSISNIEQKPWWGLNECLNTYPMLKEFANIFYPNTEIISVNPVGLRGLFHDVYTQEYLDANPDVKTILGDNIEILKEEVICNKI